MYSDAMGGGKEKMEGEKWEGGKSGKRMGKKREMHESSWESNPQPPEELRVQIPPEAYGGHCEFSPPSSLIRSYAIVMV
jgi:hypothetical protein